MNSIDEDSEENDTYTIVSMEEEVQHPDITSNSDSAVCFGSEGLSPTSPTSSTSSASSTSTTSPTSPITNVADGRSDFKQETVNRKRKLSFDEADDDDDNDDDDDDDDDDDGDDDDDDDDDDFLEFDYLGSNNKSDLNLSKNSSHSNKKNFGKATDEPESDNKNCSANIRATPKKKRLSSTSAADAHPHDDFVDDVDDEDDDDDDDDKITSDAMVIDNDIINKHISQNRSTGIPARNGTHKVKKAALCQDDDSSDSVNRYRPSTSSSVAFHPNRTTRDHKKSNHDTGNAVSSSWSPQASNSQNWTCSSSMASSRSVALCIVGDTKCPQSLEKRLAEIACKKYNIKSKHFYVWQNLDESSSLSEDNMLYFIKDLATQFIDGQVDEVEKLLFDKKYLQEKDENKYKVQRSFLQGLGDTFLQQTQQRVWFFISSQLANKDVGSVIELEGKHSLLLLLQDQGIDRKGRLREKLGVIAEESDMIVWTPATVVTKVSDGADTELYDLEKDKILTWFEENIGSVGQVFVHPSEKVQTIENADGCVIAEIGTYLQDKATDDEQSAYVIVFKEVDKHVINFVPYGRKVIQNILPFCADNALLVVMDIRSLTGDIHKALKEIFRDKNGHKIPVTLSSAFDPSSKPISIVLAQISPELMIKQS